MGPRLWTEATANDKFWTSSSFLDRHLSRPGCFLLGTYPWYNSRSTCTVHGVARALLALLALPPSTMKRLVPILKRSRIMLAQVRQRFCLCFRHSHPVALEMKFFKKLSRKFDVRNQKPCWWLHCLLTIRRSRTGTHSKLIKTISSASKEEIYTLHRAGFAHCFFFAKKKKTRH